MLTDSLINILDETIYAFRAVSELVSPALSASSDTSPFPQQLAESTTDLLAQ